MGAEIIQLFKGPADLNGESMSIKVQDHVKVAVEPSDQVLTDQLKGASIAGTRDVRPVVGRMQESLNFAGQVVAAHGLRMAAAVRIDPLILNNFASGTSLAGMAA